MYIDSILESFALSPLDEFNEYSDPYDYWNESSSDELRAMYEDAVNGTTKKNIVYRLIELIKRGLAWLHAQWRKFVNFLAGLFKRGTRSADQLVTDSGIVSSDTPAEDEEDVPIPSDKKSHVPPPDGIKPAFKTMLIKINKDNSLTLKAAEIKTRNYANDFGQVPGKKGTPMSPLTILRFVENPHVIPMLLDAARIVAEEDLKDPNVASKFANAVEGYVKAWTATNMVSNEFTFKFEQVREIAKQLNDAVTYTNKIILTDDTLNNLDGTTVKNLNALTRDIMNLQMSMNALTSLMHGIYQIDRKYFGCAKTMEELDRFVALCIKYAIPTKYISWNLYKIASKELKGEGSEYSPIWGQSRVVFVPLNSNVVHKFALSEWGRQSIRSEENISSLFKKYGKEDLIATVVKTYPNHCAVDMEKVDTNKTAYGNVCGPLRNDMNEVLRDHNVKIDIIDVHPGNIGRKNGKWCCIDYGLGDRI